MDENKEFENPNEPEANDEGVTAETENSAETLGDTVSGDAPEKSDPVKNGKKDDKQKSKKGTVIACAVALLAVAAIAVCLICFGNKGNKNTAGGDTADVTADVISDAAESGGDNTADVPEVIAPVTDKDGNVVTDNSGNAVTEKVPAADTSKPAPTGEDGDPDIVDPIVTYDEPKPEIIVEKGTDKSLWPTESLPAGIPPCKYISIDTSTKTDDDGMIVWDVSWTAKYEDYDLWLRSFELNGFKSSKKLGNYFANGKCVVAVSTEPDGDNVWVDMMIEQSKPVDYECATLDGEFPNFKSGDATLEYWIERADSGSVRVQYACASDWQVLIGAYKTDLRNAGFTADDTHAYKDVAGVTYTVYYDGDMVKSPESLFYVVG